MGKGKRKGAGVRPGFLPFTFKFELQNLKMTKNAHDRLFLEQNISNNLLVVLEGSYIAILAGGCLDRLFAISSLDDISW